MWEKRHYVDLNLFLAQCVLYTLLFNVVGIGKTPGPIKLFKC